MKPPKYYDKLFAKEYPEEAEYVAFQRELDAHTRYLENTDERLAVRAECAQARVDRFQRTLR